MKKSAKPTVYQVLLREMLHIWTIHYFYLKATVKPHLEYANAVRWPYKKGDIQITEKVKKSYKANN